MTENGLYVIYALDKLGTGGQSFGAMSASHREPNTTRAGTSVLHSGD